MIFIMQQKTPKFCYINTLLKISNVIEYQMDISMLDGYHQEKAKHKAIHLDTDYSHLVTLTQFWGCNILACHAWSLLQRHLWACGANWIGCIHITSCGLNCKYISLNHNIVNKIYKKMYYCFHFYVINKYIFPVKKPVL